MQIKQKFINHNDSEFFYILFIDMANSKWDNVDI